jgi:hypothetical protein
LGVSARGEHNQYIILMGAGLNRAITASIAGEESATAVPCIVVRRDNQPQSLELTEELPVQQMFLSIAGTGQYLRGHDGAKK